jgi:hypothetical protein
MQIENLLIERTSDDIIAHRKAMTAFRLVSQYAYKHPPDFQDDGRFYGLDPDKVGLSSRFGMSRTIILVGLRKVNSQIMAGAVWNFTEPLENRFTRAMAIYGMREFTDDEFRRTVNSTAFMSTFVHEFIHLLDMARTNNKIDKPYDSKNKPQYYNDPAELNAFFHTFADNWLDCLHNIDESPESAADLLSLYAITGDFKIDLAKLIRQSGQSQEFFDILTKDRRKSVLARLYRLHKEITDRLNSSSTY